MLSDAEARSGRWFSGVWTWSTVIFFYLSAFVFFCAGAIFIMPVLLTANFCFSIAILVQSQITIGPLSVSQPLGRLLSRRATEAQKFVQIPIGAWVVGVHLTLVFPLSILTTLILSSYLKIPVLLRDIIVTLPKKLGLENGDDVDTVPKMIICLWRCTKSGILRAPEHGVGIVGSTSVMSSEHSRKVMSQSSAVLWSVANSSAVDLLAKRVLDFRSTTDQALRWIEGVVAVFIIAPGYHFGGDGSLPLFFVQQLWLLFTPLSLFFYFSKTLSAAATELDAKAYSRKQMSNASIYESLSVMPPIQANGTSRNSLVRLITISPGEDRLPVSCSLQVVDLSCARLRPYEALSYVWGPPDLAQTIQVNQKPFFLSSSLFQALYQLRHPTEPRAIWIDALCINQDDLVERGSQVLLMHNVYSTAARVVVWLGEEQPWGLNHLIEQTKQSAMPNASRRATINYGAMRAISILLGRPWWNRMWVVQELVLAREVKLHCGTNILDWDHFCFLVDNSKFRGDFPTSRDHLGFWSLRSNREKRAVGNSDSVPDQKKRTGHSPSTTSLEHATDLLSLIFDFRAREATEPRDKVFALQGLAEGRDSLVDTSGTSIGDPPLLVGPDYTRRVSFLSIDLARAHIHRCRTLSVVAFSECARQLSPTNPDSVNDNREEYVPSWCPAFMNPEAVRNGLQWRPLWTGLPGYDDTVFSAAGNLPTRSPAGDPESLASDTADRPTIIYGYPYKLKINILPDNSYTITDVGPAAGGNINDLLDDSMNVLAKRASTFTTTFQSRLHWKTVLPTWRRMAEMAYQLRSAQVAISEKGHRRQTSRNELSLEEGFHLAVTAGKFSSASASDGDGRFTYSSARDAACANRRFFVTADGRFGLGPTDMQVGDEIRVALGSQVPVVLSKCEENGRIGWSGNDWLYVGQAYLQELMFYRGDLEDDIRCGRVKLEERLLV